MSKKIATLKMNNDFKRAYKKGKYHISPIMVTYVMKNRTNNIRYGITTSKKVGCAVQRNRARRIIRQAFFELSDKIGNGYDIVFVARAKTPFCKTQQVKKSMKKHLCQEGLLNEKSFNSAD